MSWNTSSELTPLDSSVRTLIVTPSAKPHTVTDNPGQPSVPYGLCISPPRSRNLRARGTSAGREDGVLEGDAEREVLGWNRTADKNF